jgi:hypothetical protein
VPEPVSPYQGAAQLDLDGVAADHTLDAVRAGVRSDRALAACRVCLVGIVRGPPIVHSVGDQAR